MGTKIPARASTAVARGSLFTVSSDVTNIDLTVNSANDGGWRLWGFINAGTAGDVGFYLEPNADASNSAVGGRFYGTEGSTGNAVTLDTFNTVASLNMQQLLIAQAGGNANRAYVSYSATFLYRDGVGGLFTCDTVQMSSPTAITGGQVQRSVQVWTGTASAWTTLRIGCSGANGIKYNGGVNPSWVIWQPMGF